jgi:hypothetical protein
LPAKNVTSWVGFLGVAILAIWFLLTLLYNIRRKLMRRLVRPWDVAMLLPGWRLFTGIPRHLSVFVRGVSEHGPVGDWKELGFFASSSKLDWLLEIEYQKAYLVYLFLDDLTDASTNGGSVSVQDRVAYQGLVRYLWQQTSWSRYDTIQFQIVQRISQVNGAGQGAAAATILFSSPEVHHPRTGHGPTRLPDVVC